jgi:hypothetical protein
MPPPLKQYTDHLDPKDRPIPKQAFRQFLDISKSTFCRVQKSLGICTKKHFVSPGDAQRIKDALGGQYPDEVEPGSSADTI